MKMPQLWMLAGSLMLVGNSKGSIPDEGHCIWYDVGDENPEKPGMQLNKVYNGKAKPLTDPTSLKMLDDNCPLLMTELRGLYGEEIRTCCSPANVANMTSGFQQMNYLVKKCPACELNLKTTFCYFTCHPRHSNFLIPNAFYPSNENATEVWALDYYITDRFTNATYQSCKNVYSTELNMPALVVMCGNAGSNCDPHRLFTYLGNNDFAPFNITYKWSESLVIAINPANGTVWPMTPFDTTTEPCNSTDASLRCLCSDCRDSCPALPDIDDDHHWPMVGSMDALTFALVLVYGVLAVAIIVASCCCWDRQESAPSYPGGSPSCMEELTAALEKGIKTLFTCLGRTVARHPYIFLCFGAVFIISFGVGVAYLQVTTNPVDLWASPNSRTRLDKDYFDSHFSPFYRTTQIIIRPKGYDWFNVTLVDETSKIPVDYLFGPALNESFLEDVMVLQHQITSLVGINGQENITLNDVCVSPMAPVKTDCLIQSVLNYWQNDAELLGSHISDGTYTKHFVNCINNPSSVIPTSYCLGSYGGPVFPYTALGGFLKQGDAISVNPRYTESTALVITILINNYLDQDQLEPALAWEKRFLEFMKEVTVDEELTAKMDIAYNSERGIQDELMRESVNDVLTIFISYLIMFIYITLSLGNVSSECRRLLIDSKMTLALGGVILVMLSVVASLGLYGYIGVPATLFVIEVIPFLVLAVGVDNIFILVQTWQREPRRPGESVEEHVGRVVGEVAPSMLISTSAEALCFFLGALSDMPAVYAFSLYAALALVIDFFLQMTCFVALMSLDARRVEDNRWDVLCCIKGSKSSKHAKNSSICYSIFQYVYAPFILKDVVRVLVCLLSLGVFCASLAVTPKISVGLEQELSMPEDSYVIKYFKFLNEYLSVGPPVYFVMKEGYNFSDVHEQNLVCQVSGCYQDSITQQIFLSSLQPDQTYLASGAMSWLGPYLSWLEDSVGTGMTMTACCRLDKDGDFVNTSAQFDMTGVDTCFHKDDFEEHRPKPKNFMTHLNDFLNDNPHGLACSFAGHPAYGEAVKILDDGNETYVGANYFMTYHTILRTSAEFTGAMDWAYKLSDYMTAYLQKNSTYSKNIEVFPYSIFYVFYEQYLTMWRDTGINLAISVGSVFAVMFILTLDLVSSLIILVTICMIIVDMMGMMYWWSISLNAVSLVNLVMAVGISVEFCSHVTHAFATSIKPSRVERARDALANMGSSVLSGITLTKFFGIIVLAFAQSQIFRVFYFRMYLCMIVFGAYHGLVFLPVFLSLCGPGVNRKLLKDSLKKSVCPQGKTNTGFVDHKEEKDGRRIVIINEVNIQL